MKSAGNSGPIAWDAVWERHRVDECAGEGVFVAVGEASAIPDGGYIVAEIAGQSVLVARLADEVFAVENRCSHNGSPLEGGRVRRGRIACPLHGAIFDLRTGASLAGNLAPRGLRSFPTRVEAGKVFVGTEASPAVA